MGLGLVDVDAAGDPVWTPGERFRDMDDDGMYDSSAATEENVIDIHQIIDDAEAELAGRLFSVERERGGGERARAVTDLPLCVGLGVSTRSQAAQIAGYADGVIVGSALVRAIGEDPTLGGLRTLTQELAAGVRDR